MEMLDSICCVSGVDWNKFIIPGASGRLFCRIAATAMVSRFWRSIAERSEALNSGRAWYQYRSLKYVCRSSGSCESAYPKKKP